MRRGRQEQLVEVAEHSGERLCPVGGSLRQPFPQLARLDLGEYRQVADAVEVRRHPVERRGPVLAEAHLRSFSTAGHGRVFTIWSAVSHARRACATPRST